MDFRLNSRGFCFVLCTIALVISLTYGKECRLCKPGYYASRQCTQSHDTVCKPCSKGSFTIVANVFPKCCLCSRCDVGEFVVKECSKQKDTVCKLCSDVKNKNSNLGSYQTDCLHIQNDQPSPETDLAATNTLAQSNDNIYESSSDPDADVIHVDVLYGEGSGESVTEEVDRNKTVDISAGKTPSVIEAPIQNVTLDILPEVTTKKAGIVIVDGGIVLSNNTDNNGGKDVLLDGGKTTLQTIILEGDNGIEISPAPEHIHDVNVDIEDGHHARTGASKHEQHEKSGMSIGVVVTVGLVAALVFFILGFIASKYWNSRRERTFNVQEAERFNGKPPVECSGIEYKDDERPGNKASIYDEVPSGKKLNGNTNEPRDPEKAADPVYSKPIKRENAQKTSTAPPVPAKRGDPSSRPTSEIRYIDEEQDEETDRLLSTSGSGSDAKNVSSSSTSSGNSENKLENGAPDDEKTPMLSKGNDTQKS